MLKKLFSFYTVCIIIISLIHYPVQAKVKIITIPTQTSLVVDYKTGRILHERNSKVKIFPASLTKLMTLYLVFEAIEAGKLKINQKLYVSKNAEKMLPTKLGLKAKETITVKDSIAALAIKSANDVAVVVAENIKGNEEKFVKLMNLRAKQLGMKATYFTNASGWHHPIQQSTARDLAKLAMAIKRDFPQHYNIFAENSFIFRGKIIKGHNKINETYHGAEGLKTGYTTPAGYNLITAATRQEKSLLAIVTGCRSAVARHDQMVKLLDTHFGTITPPTMLSSKPINNLKLAVAGKKVPITKKVAVIAGKKVPTTKKVVANLKLPNKKKLSNKLARG